MTLEEFIERVKRGLIKLETRKGEAIMIDEEKGEYGLEFYKLEDLPQRVSIEKRSADLLKAYPESPISFQLLVRSKVDKALSVNSIRCRIKCGHIPLQVVEIKEGDTFASNGCETGELPNLPPLGEISVSIPFNTYICQRIPEENRWDLDGYINFKSSLGEFKRSFSLNAMKLKEEDWRVFFPGPTLEV